MLDTNWLDRLDRERRVGNVPGDQARALVQLWTLVMNGDDMPAEQRVADLAGVSKRTVARAKVTGRALGLLVWERQWDVLDGLRQERPCSYRVEMPAAPCVRRERQPVARSVSRSVKQQLAALPMPDAAMLAMLSARSAAMFGRRQTR